MRRLMSSGYFKGYMVWLIILLWGGAAVSSLPARQTESDPAQESIVEQVTVTNVEVPVRVLHKGKPVTGLTKEDFTIYENNKKVEINGFFVKRRQISLDRPTGEEMPSPNLPAPSPRMFVLAFNVTNYNQYFQEAVDHLFDSILRPSDHVIFFANNTTRQYPRLRDTAKIKQQIIDDLKKESKQARIRLLEYINQLEKQMDAHEFRNLLRNLTQNKNQVRENPYVRGAQLLVSFLRKYLHAWNDYKKRYLSPRVEQFYYFARYLEKVKAEKYVLNFYQFELFPKIRLNSQTMQKIRDISNVMSNTNDGVLTAQGHLINNLLNQLNIDYDLNRGFPTEEISKLFYKVNATFHSFFLRPTTPETGSEFEYQAVASDLERVMKGITEITGGKNITSNHLVESLDTISQVEDVYYLLTYVPLDPDKTGKLKIETNNKKYQVLYDDNFRADYINEYLGKLEERIKTPDVKIEDFSFERKILAFTIKDYLMRLKEKTDKTPVGILKVRIRLSDSLDHSLFDQEKMLTAQKAEMKISLPVFKTIKPGEYNFTIDATDWFTGKEANLYEKVRVK